MRRSIRTGWLLLIILLLALPPDADARWAAGKLERFLKKELLPELPPGARLQLSVRDARSGEVMFSRLGETNCVPASTLKLLTAGFALHNLGPYFRFYTRLELRRETSRSDTLCGDLVLVADGDPSLTSDDLEQLAGAMASEVNGRYATDLLQGDLILETFIFDTLQHGPGWMWDDGDRDWAAPITGLIVNGNCVGLEFQRLNDEQRNYLLPPLAGLELLPAGGNSVRRRAGNRIVIGTGVYREETPRLYVRNLEQPQLVYGRALLDWVREGGLNLSGDVVVDNLQGWRSMLAGFLDKEIRPGIEDRPFKQWDLAFEHLSVPLSELMRPLLRESSNLYAEALFKRTAARLSREPGSWKLGARYLHAWLADSLGLDDGGQLVDGSGMSRYNLVSPDLMTAALDRFRSESWFPQLRAALPVMGRHGTVTERDIAIPGVVVRAKTGSLRNHKLIAGYIEREQELRWIFFINIDGFYNEYELVTDLQDRLIRFLAELK